MRGILRQRSTIGQDSMTTDFEVRCDDCSVSYPIGTKRCMYCGGRPGHKPLFARQLQFDPLGELELSEEPIEPIDSLPSMNTPIDQQDDEAGEQPRSSLFRLFGNLSWVILFALITLYRACTG